MESSVKDIHWILTATTMLTVTVDCSVRLKQYGPSNPNAANITRRTMFALLIINAPTLKSAGTKLKKIVLLIPSAVWRFTAELRTQSSAGTVLILSTQAKMILRLMDDTVRVALPTKVLIKQLLVLKQVEYISKKLSWTSLLSAVPRTLKTNAWLSLTFHLSMPTLRQTGPEAQSTPIVAVHWLTNFQVSAQTCLVLTLTSNILEKSKKC